jgi:Flp pilus assembly protein TadG
MRIFGRIAGDTKGALAIEFAFVAPLFLLLLLVIVELGLTLTTQSLLDGATRDAARLIRTGQVQSQTSPITTFQTLLCNDMKPLMSVSKCDSNVIFEVQIFSTFGSVSFTPCTFNNNQTGTGTQCSFTPGSSGNIVAVRASYNRTFIVPWVGACMSGGHCWTGPGSHVGSNGTGGITLTSTVIFQNEPFT